MGNTYYTSDIHFGHVNIIDYCPARRRYLGLSETDGVAEMNEALVSLWNDQVEAGDAVYILGDLCMGKVAETLAYVERLNGHKILVPGNHDRMHPIMYKSDTKTAEWIGRYSDAGIDVQDPGPYTWSIDGINCTISHFPYFGDHTEEARYGSYRPANNGLPLVHGHVHDHWTTIAPSKEYPAQYNVGIDAWNGVFRTPKDIGGYFRSVGC